MQSVHPLLPSLYSPVCLGPYHISDGEIVDVGCFETFLFTRPEEPQAIDPKYFVYTKDNRSSPVVLSWDETFKECGLFGKDDKLTFIIHGYIETAKVQWMADIRDALLSRKDSGKAKVVLVDWQNGAKGPDYFHAARNVDMVARVTAELIVRLMKKCDINEKNIHLIGHSLGGQMVGYAIKFLREERGVKVGRATALDAASIGFMRRGIYPNKDNAHFLEAIHVSAGENLLQGKVGVILNYGHIDYYPNGGVIYQPGCTISQDYFCSHQRGNFYYADMMKNDGECEFEGVLCSSWKEAVESRCNGKTNRVKDPISINSTKEWGTDGIVYLETKSKRLNWRC